MNKLENNKLKDYNSKTDEELIEIIKKGDKFAQDYILNKYKPLVKLNSRTYFIMGADNEDIIQEGMIGLYKAIRDFKPDKNTSFKVFAELCINRQIISAIKAATRQKHIPLNSYISLNKTAFDENNNETYLDMLEEKTVSDPETVYIVQEDKTFIEKKIDSVLSDFEAKVLNIYLHDLSYAEISKITGRSEKSIDNALQRIKRKIEKFMEEKKLDMK